jgi:DNA-binding NarL/FixJ family response regulator
VLILIVDDHELIRKGLAQALRSAGHNIAGEAATVAEARAQLLFTKPDLVVVDINLPDISGIELCSKIRKEFPGTQVIALSTFKQRSFVTQMIGNGAAGYLVKSADREEIETAIQSVFAAPARPHNRFDLTQRELDLIQILQRGWSAKEMGSHLFLSEATVKTHLAAIYRKLEVKNRTQAIVVAIANQLIV